MMDQDIKARWVAKLREPGRRQTKGVLQSASGAQCCLGVLCEIAVEDGVIDPPTLVSTLYAYAYMNSRFERVFETETLPPPVIKWSGVEGANPGVRVEGFNGYPTLSGLNDEYNFDFPRIADVIEADSEL